MMGEKAPAAGLSRLASPWTGLTPCLMIAASMMCVRRTFALIRN